MNEMLSTAIETSRSTRARPWDAVAIAFSALLMLVLLYLALLYAPRERMMGDVYRILFIHAPLAWDGLLAFGVTFALSIVYLRARRPVYDRWAAASAEIGWLFTTLMLITGSLWAKAVWGAYWVWEPRLTTAFLLWLAYAFYLILRRYVEQREKMRVLAAAYGIIAFINVPIVYMSIRWWRTMHPVLLREGGFQMDLRMTSALMFGFVAFTVFYGLLLWQRARVGRVQERVECLRENVRGR